MKQLLKIEWLKMRHYKAFWWMFAIALLSYPGVNYIMHRIYLDNTSDPQRGQIIKMLVGNPFALPEAWHTVAWASSLFIFIPCVLIIMFITNEYTYKTHRQNIIDGWSRNQFMTAKMLNVFIITLLLTILYILTSLGIGYLHQGEGKGSVWEGSHYILRFFLMTFYQLSIAFFIAFLVRKAFISLGIFLFYSLVLENVLWGIGEWKFNGAGRWLPLEASDRMVPYPTFFYLSQTPEEIQKVISDSDVHFIPTIIYGAIVWFLCFRINKRRDL